MKYIFNPVHDQKLQGYPSTDFVKTTAGQTIQVTTSAELTAALAALAAAPSLLGNVTISLAAGTYADAVNVPSLAGNGYTLTLQGSTTTQVNTAATGGTAGTQTVQATVVKTLAGWALNAYRGLWIKFTGGALNGQVRVINSNTADTLTLCGEYFNSAPLNGDTFIIFSNGATVTGKVTTNPGTYGIVFQNINLTKLECRGSFLTFGQCQHHDMRSDSCSVIYTTCYILADSVPYDTSIPVGIENFASFIVLTSTLVYGTRPATNSIGVFAPSGFTRLFSSVVENCDLAGIFSRLSVELSGGFGNKTNTRIQNNTTGLYAGQGGAIYHSNEVTFAGNVTDMIPAAAANPSWIGT